MYLITVRKKLSEGIQIGECESFLIKEGLREDQVAQILRKAKEPIPEYENFSKSNIDDNTLKWFGSFSIGMSILLKIFIWYLNK